MIVLFAATFALVFLKAIQQQNVIGGQYWLVPPVSFGMAAAEVVIILNVVTAESMLAVLPMGLGGGIGAIIAMYLHRKWFGN